MLPPQFLVLPSPPPPLLLVLLLLLLLLPRGQYGCRGRPALASFDDSGSDGQHLRCLPKRPAKPVAPQHSTLVRNMRSESQLSE